MKQLSIKLVLFLCIALIPLKLLDIFYTRYTNDHKNVCQKPDWIMAHEGQHFDFAFLGNSRVYNMVDVPLIESKIGKTGINLGMTGTNYSEMYLMLDQFLKNKNTVKNLIVEVDLMSLNAKKVNFFFHSYLYMHLFNDTTVLNIYKDNTTTSRYLMWKYVPFLRYMEFSNRFVFYKMVKGGFECQTFDGLDNTKGAVYQTGQKFEKSLRIYYWTVDNEDRKYLERIIAYAKKNNINLIFYNAPVYSPFLKAQLNHVAVMQTAKDICEKEYIKYFDFSDPESEMNMDKSNFYDNTHLNYAGVKKFCLSLCDSLKPVLK